MSRVAPLLLLALGADAATALGQARVEGVLRSRDGVVAHAAVFLVEAGGRMPSGAPTRARIDQLDLQFVPQLVVVNPGSTVEFPNSDVVMHNVFHPGGGDRGFDLGTYPRTEIRTFTFEDEGLYVMLCHVHPEMVGYVAVVPSGYKAATSEEGRFQIDSVPPGDYRLHVWHRRFADPDMAVTVRAEGANSFSLLLAPAERKRASRRR